MTYYKALAGRLRRCGWVCIDEAHDGDLVDYYFKFTHPGFSNDEASQYIIEMTTASNKDGTPGKILKLWQGGRRCHI